MKKRKIFALALLCLFVIFTSSIFCGCSAKFIIELRYDIDFPKDTTTLYKFVSYNKDIKGDGGRLYAFEFKEHPTEIFEKLKFTDKRNEFYNMPEEEKREAVINDLKASFYRCMHEEIECGNPFPPEVFPDWENDDFLCYGYGYDLWRGRQVYSMQKKRLYIWWLEM